MKEKEETATSLEKALVTVGQLLGEFKAIDVEAVKRVATCLSYQIREMEHYRSIVMEAAKIVGCPLDPLDHSRLLETLTRDYAKGFCTCGNPGKLPIIRPLQEKGVTFCNSRFRLGQPGKVPGKISDHTTIWDPTQDKVENPPEIVPYEAMDIPACSNLTDRDRTYWPEVLR